LALSRLVFTACIACSSDTKAKEAALALSLLAWAKLAVIFTFAFTC